MRFFQISHQAINHDDSDKWSFPFPIVLILHFMFYMGWLRVAETMLNPFGDDDNDFEVNSLIDFNLQMSYLIVDEMHNEHPELLKDQYWNEMPKKLPDRVVDESSTKEQIEPMDVFDVDPKHLNKRTTIYEHDLESFGADEESVNATASRVSIDPSLIPRASVIDANYQKVSQVEVKQSNLEKEMEKSRQKMLGENNSDMTLRTEMPLVALVHQSDTDSKKSVDDDSQSKHWDFFIFSAFNIQIIIMKNEKLNRLSKATLLLLI